MNTLNILGKGLLITALLCGFVIMALTGAALYWGWGDLPTLMQWHYSVGAIFVAVLIIHIIHRRKKLRKNITQATDVLFKQKYPAYCNLDRLMLTFENVPVIELAEKLALPLPLLLDELKQGRVSIQDPTRSLRENLKDNDERLFSAITIALKLRFNP